MGAEDEDENDDNVSLTSTTWTEFRSDYDEEQEQFTVDKVIGETEDEENYLLQWVGYPVERSVRPHYSSIFMTDLSCSELHGLPRTRSPQKHCASGRSIRFSSTPASREISTSRNGI